MRRLAVVFAATLAACDKGHGKSCEMLGSWRLIDDRIRTSGSVCASLPKVEQSSAQVRNQPGSEDRIGWIKGDHLFVGTIDGCALSVSTKLVLTRTDPGGRRITTISEIARKLTFSGKNASGTAVVKLATSPRVMGTPCTASYSTSATR
jgi:hypothetical protein